MFTWKLELKHNQIQILQDLRERSKNPESFDWSQNSFFLTGSQVLLAEGLIRHVMPKSPNEDKTKTGWFITDKGLKILEFIEEDMQAVITRDKERRKKSLNYRPSQKELSNKKVS